MCLRKIRKLNIFLAQLQNEIVQNARYHSLHPQGRHGQGKFVLKCTYACHLQEAVARKNFRNRCQNVALSFQVFHQKYQRVTKELKLTQE